MNAQITINIFPSVRIIFSSFLDQGKRIAEGFQAL